MKRVSLAASILALSAACGTDLSSPERMSRSADARRTGGGTDGGTGGATDGGTTTTFPDPATPGVVSCYASFAPDQTCAPGVACNFSNYSSTHDGQCSNDFPQTYGLATCDGPEDCAAGSVCCVVMGFIGDAPVVNMACQATACATGNGNFELCHPTGNPSGTCADTSKQCVLAGAAADFSIAQNLHVCN